jgi:hypothetical protein
VARPDASVVDRGHGAPRPCCRRRENVVARPQRIFRVVGVGVLLAGAVAGGVLGTGRGRVGHKAPLDAALIALAGTGAGGAASAAGADGVDAARAAAIAAARAKAAAVAAEAAIAATRANQVVQRGQAANRSQTRTTSTVPASCADYTGSRALGCALLLDAGFGLEQMPCLDHMWTKESGWNPKSRNATSGAYGIPQALPADKMAQYGSDWLTNPVPQIKWGLSYIENRYTSPCGAWSFWQLHGWY